MSFIGEPAKTKKQAEKNSALAAWEALKQSIASFLISSFKSKVLHGMFFIYITRHYFVRSSNPPLSWECSI
jgi:hypothetical protein